MSTMGYMAIFVVKSIVIQMNGPGYGSIKWLVCMKETK